MVDTLDSGASVNSVDLDAVVDGDFFAVIVFRFLRVCELHKYPGCTVQLTQE